MPQGSLNGKNNKPEKGRKPPKRITATYLHNAGLYYLQRFSSSSANFRKVMMRKIDRSCAAHADLNREECKKLLESQITRFQEAGLLNDAAYSRGMVDSLRRRGLSARMIHAKLQSKGMGREEIEKALATYDETASEDPEIAAALKFARRKKIGPFAKGPQEPQKSLAAMARAGFTYETARRVLEMNEEEII